MTVDGGAAEWTERPRWLGAPGERRGLTDVAVHLRSHDDLEWASVHAPPEPTYGAPLHCGMNNAPLEMGGSQHDIHCSSLSNDVPLPLLGCFTVQGACTKQTMDSAPHPAACRNSLWPESFHSRRWGDGHSSDQRCRGVPCFPTAPGVDISRRRACFAGKTGRLFVAVALQRPLAIYNISSSVAQRVTRTLPVAERRVARLRAGAGCEAESNEWQSGAGRHSAASGTAEGNRRGLPSPRPPNPLMHPGRFRAGRFLNASAVGAGDECGLGGFRAGGPVERCLKADALTVKRRPVAPAVLTLQDLATQPSGRQWQSLPSGGPARHQARVR